MSNIEVSQLQPELIWRFFSELAQIPRESKKEDRAVQWLMDTGRALGCEVETQPIAGPGRPLFANVLLRKPAKPGCEHFPAIALQAHIDMVCEKNEGVAHDFSTDPLQLRIIDGNVWATDTTLGADNGIGLCAALAALADPDLQHGPLEVLVTVDEEAGMSGARNLKPGWLKADYLLNLDSEEEGEATISCAGAIDSIGTRPISMRPLPEGHEVLAIKVRGLRGGHSGLNIGEGRGNALKILGQVMFGVHAGSPSLVCSVQGGNKRNAIPREATALMAVPVARAERARHAASLVIEHLTKTFADVEPGLTVTVESAEPVPVMNPADSAAILHILGELPNAVVAMSADVPGLVQTSTNLGIATTSKSAVEINLLSRSSVDSEKLALASRISETFLRHGFAVRQDNDYPGWKPQPDSDVVQLVKRVHLEEFGRELKITAIHAGLECGLIGLACPDLQMISFGPSMWGVHTPQEHVSIASVANFWKLLRAVLERAGARA